MKTKEPEVVVVGGGALGHAVAREISVKTTKLVCLARLTDSDRPRAASKLNHGWDQSGLYYFEADPEVASQMHQSSVKMHTACGVRPCQELGVMGVASPEEAEQLLRAADQLGLTVEILSDTEARYLLGEFFNPKYIYFRVPDTRLDQPKLMRAMRRDMLMSQQVDLLELHPDEEIVIEPEPAAYGGFLLKAGAEKIDAPLVIVCAGFKIPSMFDRIGIPHPLVVDVSPLMRARDVSMIKAPLYVDNTSTLSLLTQYGRDGVIQNIIGNRSRRRLRADEVDHLSVTEDQVDSIIELLPAVWRSFAITENFPVTAGPKVEPASPSGARSIKPWIFDASECSPYTGLWAAVPIKATNSWWTMELLLERTGILQPQEDLTPDNTIEYSVSSRTITTSLSNKPWDTNDKMHWDYKDLDDREKVEVENKINKR